MTCSTRRPPPEGTLTSREEAHAGLSALIVLARGVGWSPLFEHFLFLEMGAWIDYRQPRIAFHFWRSTSGFAVDFLLDRQDRRGSEGR